MRLWLYTAGLCGVCFLLWLFGLLVFVGSVRQTPPLLSELPNADAIMVLTGGSERVETGIALLTANKAPKLYISGVGVGVKTRELAGNLPKNLRANIILGRIAQNTRENALEIERWVKHDKLKTLLIVTSNYHMPRSILELNRRLPEATLYAVTVHSGHVKLNDWWEYSGTRNLILAEYHKYLAVLMGISVQKPEAITPE
jgi:uncharacterized SAM-binding protein YcdF (DUF218 family)